jgi:hypothetical protein
MKIKRVLGSVQIALLAVIIIFGIVQGGDRLDKINTFLQTKEVSKAEIAIDRESRFHVVYSKHELVKDDYDHVFYYILDQNGQVVSGNEIAKYLSFPDLIKIGINSKGDFFVFYIKNENLKFHLFDHQGNLKKHINSIEKASTYTICLDDSDNINIIAEHGTIYFIVINTEGDVKTKKNVTKELAWATAEIKFETLNGTRFICVWTPLDYTRPNRIIWPKSDMMGFCVFDADQLTFSTPQEILLKDVAEGTFTNELQLLAPGPAYVPPMELFKGNENVIVLATERKESQIGPTYRIRFNLKGEVIRDTTLKSQRILTLPNQSTHRFPLRYREFRIGKPIDGLIQQYLYGIDPQTGDYYLESSKRRIKEPN